MYVAILIGLLAMLFAYLEGRGVMEKGLRMAFVVITVYLAIRYDYGNDYMGYLESFNNYKYYSGSFFDFSQLRDLHGHGDFGWVFLNMLFRPLGFFIMIIVLTIVENWVVYDFVKTYVPKNWYPFALFIYVFNPYIMLVGASMMRQWLAICIFVFAFRFIRDRKPLHYFISILIAISVHSSAYILLPFYFITYLRNINLSLKSLIWFIPLLAVWLYFAPQWFSNNLNWIMTGELEENFSIYSEASGETYGILGIIAAFLFPLICISQTNKFEPKSRLLIYLFFFSIFIRPLGLVVAMVQRMAFYFTVFSIVVYPMVMGKLQKIRMEWVYIFLAIIVVPTIRDFYAFFHSTTWSEYYLHYHTIFSVPWQ